MGQKKKLLPTLFNYNTLIKRYFFHIFAKMFLKSCAAYLLYVGKGLNTLARDLMAKTVFTLIKLYAILFKSFPREDAYVEHNFGKQFGELRKYS